MTPDHDDITRFGDIYSSTQSILAQEDEYDEAYWAEDEEWYTVHEFVEMIQDRTIHWDWGGISRIRIDGQDTKYHVGRWMASLEDVDSVPTSLEELVKIDKKVMVEWINK